MPEAPVISTSPDPAPNTPIASPPIELPLQADPALETPPTGQLLLGTDKRNPVFAVYEDNAGERLLVFYGFELIEIVQNDSADPAFKLLLARLYNAKVKLSALCESFGVDPKTVRRWGKALLQGDPAELVRVLEGRNACHKLTAAVENFARWRWPDLVAQRSYGAVGRLLLEIQSVFGIEISRSGLQGLIRILKGGPAPEPSSLAAEDLSSSLPRPSAGVGLGTQGGAEGPQQTRESTVHSWAEAHAEKAPDAAGPPPVEPLTPSGNNADPTPFFPKDPAESLYWCDHAGVLVFATALAAIAQLSPTPQKILAQWMAALLLGAQNIEQTKYLNWEDLELILGQVVRFPTPQRDQLKELAADSGWLDKLWRFNQTTLTRSRNSSTDLRLYRFEYVERPWEKNGRLRQIVVQATDDKGRTIQVAILTDDLQRAAIETIKLMFQRWLQENDFKYLDKHFGINQITSYRFIEYEKLKAQVEDRAVKSAARKALDLKLKQVTEPLKRHLLAEEQAHQAHQLRAGKSAELATKLALESPADTPEHKELRRQVAALKAAELRYETTRLERRKSIEQGHKEMAALQVQITGTQAQESRLEAMIQDDMVKMEGQCKRLMDVLRITVRNLFYQALQPFKKAYDNYRDDHDYFRKLTQSPGVMEVRAQEIVIHLMPRTNYGGELRKAVIQALEGMNALELGHPCLPGRKLKFRLGQRSEMELKMNVDD